MRKFSRRRAAPPVAVATSNILPPLAMEQSVVLGGIDTVFAGAGDDPYIQALGGHAAGLDGLAALIGQRVAAGDTVLDVGANIGLSSILLARKAARVIAFEPSPSNARFLRYNLQKNGIANVDVREMAASSKPGALRFHMAQFGAGSHVVTAEHIRESQMESVAVPAVRLDDLSLPPVTFVKIDVEGHEPEVLAGARRLLARDRPLVHAELNVWCLTAFAGHSPGAFVRRLWQAFDIYDRAMSPIPESYSFLHDTIVHHQGIADLIFRPKANTAMPTLRELSWPDAALDALSRFPNIGSVGRLLAFGGNRRPTSPAPSERSGRL